MGQNKYRLGATVAMILYASQGILIVLTELPMLAESQRQLYFIEKAFLIVTAFILAGWLWRDYKSVTANTLVGIHAMLYTMQGQWYRPLYYFAFCQLSIGVSFMFSVPKKVFRPLLLVWVLGYLLVFYLTWEKHKFALQNPAFSDIVFSISATAMIAWRAWGVARSFPTRLVGQRLRWCFRGRRS